MKPVPFVVLAMLFLCSCAVKPKPFTAEDHTARLLKDKTTLFEAQEPVIGPLTLSQCIARALVYNYDNRLAIMEAVLQDKQLDAANLQMLPKLAVDGGFTARNNELGSSSINYYTRKTSLEPSVSQDTVRFTPDLMLSWSILDLGVSYFQAKQQADRYLVALERRRRVINNIVKEVIAAYWKVATAQQLAPQIAPVLDEAEKALETLKSQENDPLQPVLTILDQEKGLLQLISQLRRINSDLLLGKAQLAALINLPPDADMQVPDGGNLSPPQPLTQSVARFETIGLFYRPDLREQMYQERIDGNNVRKEIMRLIPGLSLLGSLNADTNSYLVNNLWAEAGAKLTANLMNLVQGPKNLDAAKAVQEVTATRRLALTMAAIVQINVSYHQYTRTLESYQDAQAVSRVEDKIIEVVNTAAAVESEMERIKRAASAIASNLERDRNMAEAYKSLGNLYFSIGADIVPADADIRDVNSLAAVVDKTLTAWRNGEFADLPADLAEPAQTPAKARSAAPTEPEKLAEASGGTVR